MKRVSWNFAKDNSTNTLFAEVVAAELTTRKFGHCTKDAFDHQQSYYGWPCGHGIRRKDAIRRQLG